MSEKGQYVKCSLFSYSGKVITIFSSFIYTFLIANYLGPEIYGLVNYYISFILGFIGLSGIAFLGGLIVVFMPRWKSRVLFMYSLFLISIISFVLFLFLFIFSENIVAYLGRSNYELFRLASFLLLIMPFTLYYTQVFKSFKMFGKELKFNAIVAILNLSVAFLLVVVFDFGVFGVVYAMLFANISGLAFLFLQSRQLKFVDSPIDFAVLKRYSVFGVPAAFLRRVSDQTLLVFMGIFIADNALGMYYIALKITSIVVSTPANTLTDVLLPYVSAASKDKRKLSRYISLNIKFSLVVTCVLSVLVVVLSKSVLLLFFPAYVGAYHFIVLLSVLFVVSSLNPLSNLFLSLNRMDIHMNARVGGLVCVVFFGLVLMPEFGVFGLIATQIFSMLANKLILLSSLKSLGMSVEIIPRKRDFVYFWNSLKGMFLVKFRKLFDKVCLFAL